MAPSMTAHRCEVHEEKRGGGGRGEKERKNSVTYWLAP